MVPPSTEAARPVEAVAKVVAWGSALRMCFSSSDFPVPVPTADSSISIFGQGVVCMHAMYIDVAAVKVKISFCCIVEVNIWPGGLKH